MGRPKSDNPTIKKTVSAEQWYWDYIALYLPGDNESAQFREAVEALKRMRPAGPDAFGHAPGRAPRQRKPYKAIEAYAHENGLTRYEAEAAILKKHFENKNE